MRKPKLKWTPEETKALIEGINKHGVSHWKIILDDPQFSHILRFRSNTDLRIKWRNMNLATQKQIEGLSTDEETALGALGELKYGVGNWKSNQEDPEFNKCSDSGSDVVVEHQNMNVEASMPQPAIQIQDQLNVESNQIAECKRRPPKRKMSEMRSEFDANAQAESDAEEESEAKAEAETEAEAKAEATRQQGLLNHWKKQKKE